MTPEERRLSLWRMENAGGRTPPHWRFYQGDEALPRFTLGDLTGTAAAHVLESLNAYERTSVLLQPFTEALHTAGAGTPGQLQEGGA
jgi:hypothetical protein